MFSLLLQGNTLEGLSLVLVLSCLYVERSLPLDLVNKTLLEKKNMFMKRMYMNIIQYSIHNRSKKLSYLFLFGT